VTALIAAVPGFIDLLAITEPKLKRIGIIHMAINLAMVILYVINFIVRQGAGPNNPIPLIMSAIGVLLLGVSGWLGGELVHAYGVTVADRRPDEKPKPA